MPHPDLVIVLKELIGTLSPSKSLPPYDLLSELPPDVSAVLHSRPQEVLSLAHEKLHIHPYKDVPSYWRACYEEAAIGCARSVVEQKLDHQFGELDGSHFTRVENLKNQELGDSTTKNARHHSQRLNEYASSSYGISIAASSDAGDSWIEDVVRRLDMALIMTGAPQRKDTIDAAMAIIELYINATSKSFQQKFHDRHPQQEVPPPTKRRRVSDPSSTATSPIPRSWPIRNIRHPQLRHPIERAERLSLASFQAHLDCQSKGPDKSIPLIISGAISHWPALDPSTPERHWSNPQYLLKRTLGGRRLVPIETGRSYTDEGWGQKITTVNDFVKNWMLKSSSEQSKLDEDRKEQHDKRREATAYLAQHDLFAQIPALRNDISIPDYCYSTPPGPSSNGATTIVQGTKNDEDLALNSFEEPLLNAWFGPSNTMSPAHTDPHHNIFAQVVGYKYVRLFAPSQRERMYPHGVGEDGVDMGNTSRVDIGDAMRILEGWDWDGIGEANQGMDGIGEANQGIDEADEEFKQRFPLHKEAEYLEGVLGPGECLYMPQGWWHYVRSLSPSFSVSFWWD